MSDPEKRTSVKVYGFANTHLWLFGLRPRRIFFWWGFREAPWTEKQVIARGGRLLHGKRRALAIKKAKRLLDKRKVNNV